MKKTFRHLLGYILVCFPGIILLLFIGIFNGWMMVLRILGLSLVGTILVLLVVFGVQLLDD